MIVIHRGFLSMIISEPTSNGNIHVNKHYHNYVLKQIYVMIGGYQDYSYFMLFCIS